MKKRSIFLALGLCLAALAGCAPYWVKTPVVDQNEVTVSLEHKVRKGQVVQQQFHHPADISPENLKNLLTQLSYLADSAIYGKPERKPVFQEVEIEHLAPALVQALAKANPEQRVRFVSRNRGGGLLFKKDRQTGGVAFVETGDRLNLAFGYVNEEILSSRPDALSQADNADPLMIRSSFAPIVAPDFVEHRLTEKGNPFPLWIVADMKHIPEPPPAPAASPATGTPEAAAPVKTDSLAASEPDKALKTEPVVAPEPQTIKAEPVPLQESPSQPLKAIEKEPAPVAADKPAAMKSGDSWETRKQENTEKLRYLKELYDSGLIDEKEYKAKKEKLLEQL
ncbi:MAG: hypothetical protein AB1724_10870 [Thermodesulfobacteriota bacterium]